jgi:hypothetical protein
MAPSRSPTSTPCRGRASPSPRCIAICGAPLLITALAAALLGERVTARRPWRSGSAWTGTAL